MPNPGVYRVNPILINQDDVRARCPECDGAITVFNHMDVSSHSAFGVVLNPGNHMYDGMGFSAVQWRLLKCSGCGRAGLAKIHHGGSPNTLESFHPRALLSSPIPDGVPSTILNEFREAELCMSVEAWRGASALLRSTLEKTLEENGYLEGSLHKKIDDAASDGVITAARKQKAHDDIRVLGNEVVHDEWREIREDEVEAALHYAQRILEDFYDDRESVVSLLVKNNRIPMQEESKTSTDEEPQ